jgi:hypothetical protein
MKIKQLFFGGSLDSFTIQDFDNARQKVNRVKTLIERFLPYYSIYTSEWDPNLYSYDEAQKLFMESQDILNSGQTLERVKRISFTSSRETTPSGFCPKRSWNTERMSSTERAK